MPITIQPAVLKYKNGQGTYQSADCLTADPTTIIDDTAGEGDADKVWSADKTDGELSDLKSAINVLEPSASSSDVGKFLKAKTVSGGKVTEYEFGEGGGGGVSDVQVNGTSVVNQGVANVPVMSTSTFGVAMLEQSGSNGIGIDNAGKLRVNYANDNEIKVASGAASLYKPITPYRQHTSIYYGLSKLAGENLKNDTVTVGTYPEKSKSAISQMLNAPETVSGTTPSITAKAGVRYICGEVATLTVVVPATGIIDVVFESGSTATVLTVTPPTGVTAVKWANGFNPASLEANTKYEISIMDGELGAALSWT